MVSEIGTTNSLIVLMFMIFGIIGVFGIIYLRNSGGKNSPSANMTALINTLGQYAASNDRLTNQLIQDADKGYEQRDKLINVMDANQNVLVAIDNNMTVMNQSLVETRNQADAHHADLVKSLQENNSYDVIFKGELDMLRKHDEIMSKDVNEIKERLGNIEKMLNQLIDDKTALAPSELTDLKSTLQEILASLDKLKTGEIPKVDIGEKQNE